MHSIDPKDNTERQNYKLLTGTIIPRPIAFVTTMADDGTINAAPFSYFNVISSNPPMLSISIQRKNGEKKDTARNIEKLGEFVVHIVDNENVEGINQTAASLPPDESEMERTDFSLVTSEKVSVPGVNQAKVRFECKLEQMVGLAENTDLIIGKIVQFHIDDEIYEADGKISAGKLGAVSRLAGANYATIGDVFSIERPK